MTGQSARLLAGTVCFDLGVLAVSGLMAASALAAGVNVQDITITKITSMSPTQTYLKITMQDATVSSMACTQNKGKLVEFKGTKYCQTPKTGTAPR